MKRLLIIGAGGFGREVLRWVKDVQEDKRDWYVHGFLDDNPEALEKYNTGAEIIGSISDYIPEDNDAFICSIGDPKVRLKICEEYLKKGAQFINLVHPAASISSISKANLQGKGIIIGPFAECSDSACIGDFVIVNCYSAVAHDATVEKGCMLSGYCGITGYAHLEEGVFLGSHAVITPGIRVGKYSRVGAGSVVIKNVPPGVTVFGNPAKCVF